MKRLNDLAKEISDVQTMVQLTEAFEGLASMRISQIRSRVLHAQEFFNELWDMYSKLRVDKLFHFGRVQSERAVNKQLIIVITAQGGFSGDIDQRVISLMLKQYRPEAFDIIVVGHHGATLLNLQQVHFKKVFKLPENDLTINVEPLVREIRQYQNTQLFYQSYKSLGDQTVTQIEVSDAVKELSLHSKFSKDEISERTYIFEPSSYDVIAYLERSMLHITLSQTILESKLAQYASRFRAMTVAHNRSKDSLSYDKTLYNRVKRSKSDENIKQIVSVLQRTVNV